MGNKRTTLRMRPHRLLQHVCSTPPTLSMKDGYNGGAEAALGNWQPVWNEQVLVSTPVSILNWTQALVIYIFGVKPFRYGWFCAYDIFTITTISWHRECLDSWPPFLSYKGNAMTADGLAMQGVKSLPAMILRKYTGNILTRAPLLYWSRSS